jgi:ribonuclease T1
VRLWARYVWALLLLALVCSTEVTSSSGAAERAAHAPREAIVTLSALPSEAQETVRLIDRGGPFAYARDGVIFGNFERALPIHERGYYREYTVRTPGVKSRGARRVISGRNGELYYTDDHYRTFRRITP